MPSYTLEEKVQIAKRHLVPKQLAAHGLKRSQFRISERALAALIDGYTRESGVRSLERQIGALCRKATLKFVEEPEHAAISIKPADLQKYLGAPNYLRQPTEGQARRSAWSMASRGRASAARSCPWRPSPSPARAASS